MNAKDVLKSGYQMADFILDSQIGDLSDADLLVRPAPAANHTAWQLGHLISTEHQFLSGRWPGRMPELPAGFAELHTKHHAKDDQGFLTKQEYLDLHKRGRAVTLELLDSLHESELDQEAPESVRSFAPTIMHVFSLLYCHQFWHIGQITSLRRYLNKPVKI